MTTLKKVRGVFEKNLGSNVWWIQYFDADGRRRREKAGSRSNAIKLYHKRKTEALEGKKLPEKLRRKQVQFSELADDALEYSKSHKISYEDDVSRMKPIRGTFGNKPAEAITPQEIERWLAAHHSWSPATFNRHKALFSLVYRLGVDNGKVKANPVRRLKSKRENNSKTRFLELQEERALRDQIFKQCPERIAEFEVAVNTGMRRGEQYGLTWDCVDLERRLLTIPRSKHGEMRYVSLNDSAIAALRNVAQFSSGTGRVFRNGYLSDKTKGPREWFEKCVDDAGLNRGVNDRKNRFTWHSLRHTFASRLVMAGVDITTVQRLMGHKTIQVTLRYSHLGDEHQLAAVQKLCDTGAAQDVACAARTATVGDHANDTQQDRIN